MKVSIVIITKDNPNFMWAFASAVNQIHADKEIIVFDNGSKTPVEPMEMEGVKYHRSSKELSLSSAMNAAVELCSGEFVSFLHPNCVMKSDWISSSLTDDDLIMGAYQHAEVVYPTNASLPFLLISSRVMPIESMIIRRRIAKFSGDTHPLLFFTFIDHVIDTACSYSITENISYQERVPLPIEKNDRLDWAPETYLFEN
jgi:glycosyltransferase involved in cell wall biosynthesis